MNSDVYVGVDGGGTKTKLAIYTKSGKLLAEHLLQGCNINQLGEEQFRALMMEIEAKLAKYECRQIVLGIPAYGESHKTDMLIERAIKSIFNCQYKIYNDVDIAHFGANKLNDGIHLVAGTGSIGLLRANGKNVRIGGYGPLISDEGSGYWIGCAAMNYFSRWLDGREQTSKLCNAFINKGIGSCPELVDFVYNSGNSRFQIASFSNTVDEVAKDGDELSQEILNNAACLLAEFAYVLANNYNTDLRSVTYSGSVFKSEIVCERLERELSKHQLQFTPPLYTPEQGAVLKAMQLANIDINTMQLVK